MPVPNPIEDYLRGLCTFIDASTSPYHAVAEVRDRLGAAGYRRLDETDEWQVQPGDRAYVVRGGTLVAFNVAPDASARSGFRIIGAHTDSPNLRVRPRPDTGRAGCRQIGVEVYGSALVNSWLDRDLGISGRVAVRDASGTPTVRLFRSDRPLLRIPQLAIHLDRGVNETGLKLNPQVHLAPLWALGAPGEKLFARFVADELDVDPSDILSFDAMLHDLTPATVLGLDGELLSAPRLDNLLSCFTATEALLRVDRAGTGPPARIAAMCLFDHEEVGSESSSGAAGSVLPTILERIVSAMGGSRDDFHRALASSVCVSADGAHATHPNYPERHEPDHEIRLNAGPVIKTNSNVRYATDAASSAAFKLACEESGVPFQEFVARNDIPCGSTIGPITAARLGIPIVDVGVAQLAMHSARELCGAADPAAFAGALTAFLFT